MNANGVGVQARTELVERWLKTLQPVADVFCAKAKRQVQMFYVPKEKRQVQMFYVPKEKRQIQLR